MTITRSSRQLRGSVFIPISHPDRYPEIAAVRNSLATFSEWYRIWCYLANSRLIGTITTCDVAATYIPFLTIFGL